MKKKITMTKEQIAACNTAALLINEIPDAAANKSGKWLEGWMTIESSPNPKIKVVIIDKYMTDWENYIEIYNKILEKEEVTYENVTKTVEEALKVIREY